jgi:release factor glutamine methyltransferase
VVLSAAGVSSPRVDAELLAAHVLGVPRTRLAATAEFRPDQAATYRELVAARARRVPLQHLTGTAPFRHLVLAVGPGVFIPRPETELLVDWALTVITPGAIVVDLCAGSGAIALSVAREAQPMRVYAVERDPAALRWLRHNAGDSPVVSWAGSAPTEGPGALASAVQVIEGDVAEPTLLSTLDGTVDVVLCNPPYVPAGIRVPPEVAEHDPPEAVFSGADGLDVIRAVIPLAARLLRPGGWVGIEHDESQAVGVPLLLDASGHFRDVRDHPDLAGRPRFATARMADFTA